DVLALGRDGVRPREATLPRPSKLRERGEDLLARAWFARGRRGSAIRVRVVLVGHPLPNVAGEVEVAVGAHAFWMGAHVAGHLRLVDGAVGRGCVVAPRITPAIVAARGALPLCFGGEALAAKGAVLHGVVPRDAAHGLARSAEALVVEVMMGGVRRIVR